MAPEELSVNDAWHATHRERERERRRIRDRQRRRSMSLEERERHLARRRRNYQLRRQRAELNTRSGGDAVVELINIGEDENLANVPVTEVDSQFGFSPLFASPDSSGAKSEDDVVTGTGNPRRLRVHQIRHLARLLNTHSDYKPGETSSGDIAVAYGTLTKDCGSRKRLRFVHVKRLARALNSTTEKIMDENHHSRPPGTDRIGDIPGQVDAIQLETDRIWNDTVEMEKTDGSAED